MIRCFLFLYLCGLSFVNGNEDFDDISKLDLNISADCEPLTTVADCVNICSGAFFQVETDLVGNTIDPIQITRYYDHLGDYEFFMGMNADIKLEPRSFDKRI